MCGYEFRWAVWFLAWLYFSQGSIQPGKRLKLPTKFIAANVTMGIVVAANLVQQVGCLYSNLHTHYVAESAHCRVGLHHEPDLKVQ